MLSITTARGKTSKPLSIFSRPQYTSPMTASEFEHKHRIRFRPKAGSRLMAAAAYFLGSPFLTDFWTTIRFPWGPATIYFPTKLVAPNPDRDAAVLEHELVHVAQQRSAWGLFRSTMLYFFLPLPWGLSGRWWIERPAFLLDIQAGRRTVDRAVDLLWNAYLWPWPRRWMRRWFAAQLRQGF